MTKRNLVEPMSYNLKKSLTKKRCTAAMKEKKSVRRMEHLGDEKTQILSSSRYHYKFRREIIQHGCAKKLLFNNLERQELALWGANIGLWEIDLGLIRLGQGPTFFFIILGKFPALK